MIFEKAGINDLTHLVELRTDYLLEDYGSIPDEKLTAIKHNLPEYFRKHLDKDLFVFVCRDEEHIVSCCFSISRKSLLIRHSLTERQERY